MTLAAYRGYVSWQAQRRRCNSSAVDGYKYYGGKGIRVKYSSREFVGWWVEQLKSFHGNRPCVSRKNHDGHYEFENISLSDWAENCIYDVIRRHGLAGVKCRKPLICHDAETMAPLMLFASASEASAVVGLSAANIGHICKGIKPNGRPYLKTKTGFTFRYIFKKQKKAV